MVKILLVGYIYLNVLKFIDDDSFEVRKSELSMNDTVPLKSLFETLPMLVFLSNATDRSPIEYNEGLRGWVRVTSMQRQGYNTSGVIGTELRNCVL